MVRKHGFTLLELLIVIGVIGILAALAIAGAAHAQQQAQAATCVSNLRQWAMALQLYVADHSGYLPRRGQGVQPVTQINRPDDWFNALPPYLAMPTYYQQTPAGNTAKPGDKSVFVCPSATVTNSYQNFLCYGMNIYLSRWDSAEATKLVQVPNPEVLAFMADSPGGYASTVPSAAQYSVVARHAGYANVSFLDGHVKAFAGGYIGCGTGEIDQPDVRWPTLIPGDTWAPPN